MVGDRFWIHFRNIYGKGRIFNVMIMLISDSGIPINFASVYAFPSDRSHCRMESANASKQVDKAKFFLNRGNWIVATHQ